MSIDTLRAGLSRLLTSPPVTEIAFTLSHYPISRNGFLSVAERLTVHDIHRPGAASVSTRHPIHIRIQPHMPRDTLAYYDPVDNAIAFESDDVLENVIGRAMAVHECVHTLFDVARSRISGLDNELAAYLAESWYLLAAEAIIPASLIPEDILQTARSLRAAPGSTLSRRTGHALYPAMRTLGYHRGNTQYSAHDGIPIGRTHRQH